MHLRTRTPLLAATTLGVGALLALAAPLAASAHVTVSPEQADPGSYTVLDVKVPTESDDASTVKVVLDLPTDHPLLSVRYVPVPGWTAELTTEKLPTPLTAGDDTITQAVTRVTWTADAGGTPPGALEILPLSIGPVPDTGLIRFAAHQYYSDGTVVDWADASESAAHPAPRLYITDAPPTAESAAQKTTETSAAPAARIASTADSSDLVARVLAALGLVVGAAGVVVAAVALRRRSAER